MYCSNFITNDCNIISTINQQSIITKHNNLITNDCNRLNWNVAKIARFFFVRFLRVRPILIGRWKIDYWLSDAHFLNKDKRQTEQDSSDDHNCHSNQER